MIRRLGILLACVGASWASAAPPDTLPFADVKAGMKGVGRTVFHGTEIESFDVEILGTLPRIGPGQNLILGRCTGGPLGQTGVLAGMSGSPVFVDGRLVGAVAYAWGFAKEAIAGITPIEEMTAAAGREDRMGSRAGAGSSRIDLEHLARLRDPAALAGFLESTILVGARVPASAAPVSIPLSVAGIGPDGLRRVSNDLARAGFLPVLGGAAVAAAGPPPSLEPGSAVGIKLVRGDLDLTATGTVTWVDGTRVYAFGHPLYGLGDVDLPMTAARAEALLPSLERSARLALPLGEVGAFRQDRVSGLFGRLGAVPRMIPVRLLLGSGRTEPETFAFDIADDPVLSPVLLYVALNGILANKERLYGGITVRIREGSVLKVDGVDDIQLDNVFAGPGAAAYATGIPAYILYLLTNSAWEPPRIRGVNLLLEYQPEPRVGRIRRVALDRYRVRAGDSVTATVVVSPYRGPDMVQSREIRIPPETAPGRLQLWIGDAPALNRVEGSEDGALPLDLAQLVHLINDLRRNDRIYLLATREDAGVVLGGQRMPNLPPSVLGVLTRPRSQGNFAMVRRRGILEEEIATGLNVEGLVRLQLDVEAP